MKQERYRNLNILKAIASILVIAIHAPFPGMTGQLIIAFARTGVALFFLISGFFFIGSESDVRISARRKFARTMKLAVAAYLFYFIWGIGIRLVGSGVDSVKIWMMDLFRWSTLRDAIFLQVDVIAGHLWFLNALILCYLIAVVLGNVVISAWGVWGGIVLMIAHFVLGNILPYLSNIHISMDYYRNGWLYGLPVFLLGVQLRKWKDAGNRVGDRVLQIGIFGGGILLIAERIFTGYHQFYFSNLILLFGLFIWAIQNPKQMKFSFMQTIGEQYFNDIYIFQWAVISVVDKVYKIIGKNSVGYVYTILCLLLTVSGVIVYRTVINRAKKWRLQWQSRN